MRKNRCQMPNNETLIESISRQINDPASQSATYFSTMDLKYTSSQLNLDPETANHCNSNEITVYMTGTYQFQTAIFGLTDMPADFQKSNGLHIRWIEKYPFFLLDILIDSIGSEEEHKRDCV